MNAHGWNWAKCLDETASTTTPENLDHDDKLAFGIKVDKDSVGTNSFALGNHLKGSYGRLQFFLFESVSFYCEGLEDPTQLRGIRNTEEFISSCVRKSPVLSCSIRAYLEDSGEYWCETQGGERSNSVNISVTAGSVILESPVLPVMEGAAVTLRCRDRMNSSDLTADFYKDSHLMGSSSTGEMTIHSVSKSDEGLYKCHISGAGGSPESWMAVGAHHRDTCPSSDHSLYVLLLLRTVFTIVMVALLLLLVGLLHRVTQK
ncbi:low affinity immunoglobulin gamma Fc region receptor II-like [Epinephelus moara]|uniref:low affinity immunoglobulin gamma Fc region receptor II-like n=1 Tax=Epinephelus moara TaxID=300413 RepID=UPI00214E8C30|nr:low affinity immunoglobulin gamma Fc region receptor II-like [Epinephelus moara]